MTMVNENLVIFDNEYFKLNKALQKIAGLWPYDSRIKKYIIRFLNITIFILALFVHVYTINKWCINVDFGICSENLAGVLFIVGLSSKYMVSIINEKKIAIVFESLADIWVSINDPEEKAIMIKYASIGRTKSVGYTVYIMSLSFVFSQCGLIPIILDVILPLNETRNKIKAINVEFYPDIEENFLVFYICYCMLNLAYISVAVSIDTSYTAVVHQTLGMFDIVKHRLKVATGYTNEKSDYAYKKIVSAIRMHQQSITFNNLLETTYSILLLMLIIMTVLFTSLVAVAMMENTNDILLVMRWGLFAFGVMIHLFFLSWPGQLVISGSAGIYEAAYNNEWYNISRRAKIMLKIIMLRTIKPCCLTAAGLYIMNFENFGMILKSCMSYMTVLLSFRN